MVEEAGIVMEVQHLHTTSYGARSSLKQSNFQPSDSWNNKMLHSMLKV